jgi:hypothetical protein
MITNNQKQYLQAVKNTAIEKGLKPWDFVRGIDINFNPYLLKMDDYIELRKAGLYQDKNIKSYNGDENWCKVTKKAIELINEYEKEEEYLNLERTALQEGL